MESRLLQQDALAGVIRRLAGERRVLAPVRDGELVVFAPLGDGQEPALDFANTRNAPKGALFPHTETLLSYARTPKGVEFTAVSDQVEDTVVFVRPCDARSTALLDRVFDQEQCRDPYYVERRERTTVVALACSRPAYAACFCTSVGGDPVPHDGGGADVLITDLVEELLVESFTPKGDDLMTSFDGARASDDTAAERKTEVGEQARSAIRSQVPAEAARATLEAHFDHPFWTDLHQKCLACGTCTYICPTCHCFDISDEMSGDAGTRLRNWDSCMYPLFTLETSGHNPRPTQKERWRQRVMHKFRYIPENFDLVGCVGCGRCVLNCPVNLDIRKVVQDVATL